MSKNRSFPVRAVLLAAFFLSGLSALVYEVVWMRMLTLVFGTTVFAAATVITVFMGGLALGSFLFGRWVDKRGAGVNLLKLYALLELCIGLYCVLTPWAFSWLDAVYGHIYRIGEVNFYLFSIIRFLFSSLVLIFPTVLIGATLPVVSKYFVTRVDTVGRGVGMLYGLNTLGAVTGVVLTAFVLIPSLGVRGALLSAVLLNVVIAGVIYYAASVVAERGGVGEGGAGEGAEPLLQQPPLLREESKRRSEGAPPMPAPALSPTRSTLLILVPAAFAVSGFASLAYEVAWFRMLSMTIGSSVYAFSIMLATFLLGLALGSYLFSIFADRVRDYVRLFAFIEILIGLSAAVLIHFFGNLPLAFLEFVRYFGISFWGFQAVNFMTAFVAVIIPTVLMGATFPLVVRTMTGDLGRLGSNIGGLYALNTAGGVLGSFLAGFLFIPFIGVQNTIVLMVGLNLTVGCALLFASAGSSRLLSGGAIGASLVVFGVAVVMPGWDRALVSIGPFYYASNYIVPYKEGRLKSVIDETKEVVYYREGINGTTTVNRVKDGLSLAISGKVTAGVPGDVFINVLLGALPLTLHQKPESALLVGLGSGVTLGAMEQFPLKQIDVVELSAGVVEASRLFSEYNYNALDDKRLEVIVDDGRSYIAYTDTRYDVIVSAPPVPLMTGAANLHTKEFYSLARKRLNPGGLFCQWFRVYNMSPEDLKSFIRSFMESFPETSLWAYQANNIMLIGRESPLPLHLPRALEVFNDPATGSMMESIGMSSVAMLLSGFIMDSASLKEYVRGAPLNTDTHPIIEFATPKTLFMSYILDNYNELVRFRPVVVLPASGMVVKSGINGQRSTLPFFMLKSSLPGNWSSSFTGFIVKNEPLPHYKPYWEPIVGEGLQGFAEWRRTGLQYPDVKAVESPVKSAYTEGYEGRLELSTVLQGRERLSARDLKGLLLRSIRGSLGDIIDEGEAILNGHRFIWVLGDEGGVRVLRFSWHCHENGLRYVGVFGPAPDDKLETGKIIDEILNGFKCMHGPLS